MLARGLGAFAAATINALIGDVPSSELVVVNQPERTVQVVHAETGKVRLTASAGERPHEVDVSPDGRYAVIPIYGSGAVGRAGTDGSTLEILDLDSGKPASWPLGSPARPHDAKFGKDGLLYVTAELRNAVLVVDPRQFRVIGEIPTGREQSHSLAIDRVRNRAFTANVNSGSVSILDLTTRRLMGVVKAADMVQRVTVSHDGRRVFTHDQRRPRVIAIDPDRMVVTGSYALPGLPYVSAATLDGTRLVVGGRPELVGTKALPPSIYIVNLNSHEVETINLPGWPRVIIPTENSNSVWANLGSGELVRIDLDKRNYRVLAKLKSGLDGMSVRPPSPRQ